MSFRPRLILAAAAVSLTATLPAAPANAGVDPFIGEMMLFGGNFCPRGYLKADGQLLPISTYTAPFSLLGTTFGGDGRATFGVPDMRGRSAIGTGRGPGLNDVRWGQKGGQQNVTLSANQLPSHTHAATTAVTADVKARGTTTPAGARSPAGNVAALSPQGTPVYAAGPANADMDASAVQSTVTASTAVQPAGGSQAFNNQDPYLGMVWCIATVGVFPPRS